MIDKKKFWVANRITIIVILIFLVLLVFRVSYSRFHTEASGKVISDIALYVLDAGTTTENLKMFELDPDDKNYIFNISVYNYRDDDITEVDLEYVLNLVTTTNIPVEYSLYELGGSSNILQTKEIFQDDDEMYFFKFKSSPKKFTHGVKSVHEYQLVVNFPSAYNNEAYQGLKDSVSIVIDSKQI